MTLHLSPSDLSGLESLSRTLLDPLGAPSPADCARGVSDGMRALFRADRVIHWLPAADQPVLSEGVDAEMLEAHSYFLDRPRLLGVSSPDPLVTEFLARPEAARLEVYSHSVVDRILESRLGECRYYHEVERAAGMHDLLRIRAVVDGGGEPLSAGVALAYDRPGRSPFGDAGALALLGILLPSYRAGLQALSRFHAHRHALDRIDEPLALFDGDAREVHRNAALARLLAAEPESATVEAALRRSAAGLLASLSPFAATSSVSTTPVTEVRTACGRYRLRATPVGADRAAGHPAVLLAVEGEAESLLPTADALRERFPLTPREAEVALLLAEGLTNDQVARNLFVSASTARRHTENVLGKLGLRSRKALGLALLRGPLDDGA